MDEAKTEERFGRLLVMGKTKHCRRAAYVCRCDCGRIVTILRYNLIRGFTRSCGCLHRDRTVEASLKHGHTVGYTRTPEYRAWMSMKRRCLYPGHDSYNYYRKIRIAPEYLKSFERFLADLGTRPSPQHSIDRIDNAKGYEPGNIRWATREMQQQNRPGRTHAR